MRFNCIVNKKCIHFNFVLYIIIYFVDAKLLARIVRIQYMYANHALMFVLLQFYNAN